ncbi:MAG: hypothetical protein ABH889_01765 [Candidatus Portnoybacteria bacterium]
MLWEKIKRILQKEGGQCIILEQGQPTYLVKKLENEEDVEEINRDIEEAKNEESQEAEVVEGENQGVSVEDLPF